MESTKQMCSKFALSVKTKNKPAVPQGVATQELSRQKKMFWKNETNGGKTDEKN